MVSACGIVLHALIPRPQAAEDTVRNRFIKTILTQDQVVNKTIPTKIHLLSFSPNFQQLSGSLVMRWIC